MKSNYKPIGNYIRKVETRNRDLKVTRLLGLSMTKEFRETTSNTVGTDMSVYKVMSKYQFACDFMSPIRVSKLPVVLKLDDEPNLVSPAYPVFEVTDRNELDPEYLMMWFRRPEFDRYATFKCDAAIRGGYEWTELCETLIPVPKIDKQLEIVKEYNTIQNRINLNQQLIQKLEETAQAIYREWFVEGIDLEDLPVGWEISSIGKYAQVKSGFAFKSEWWQPEGIPVIKIGSISNNTIDKDSLDYVSIDKVDKAKNYVVREGDIVIAMTGATIGKVGLVPQLGQTILVNQRVGMFDLGSEPMERTPFLYFNLLTDFVQNEIKNVGGDSAQANISNGQIQEIEMLYPTNDLIQKFNKIGKPIIETILQKIKENQKLTELKALLLSKLATVE